MFKFAHPPDFVRRFKGGERAALEKVYFGYVDEVEVAVRRFLSVGARSGFGWTGVDTGDLVQEVFMRAFGEKCRASFDGSRDFGPFLGAVTRNLLIDWARRRGREVPDEDMDRLEAISLSESDEWADRETMGEVTRYLATLPPEVREIHEYRYVRCQSQEDTCAALGISRQNLRTREKHLCDGLRRHLKRLELSAGLPAPKPSTALERD